MIDKLNKRSITKLGVLLALGDQLAGTEILSEDEGDQQDEDDLFNHF